MGHCWNYIYLQGHEVASPVQKAYTVDLTRNEVMSSGVFGDVCLPLGLFSVCSGKQRRQSKTTLSLLDEAIVNACFTMSYQVVRGQVGRAVVERYHIWRRVCEHNRWAAHESEKPCRIFAPN